MNNLTVRPTPPDQSERVRALDAEKSILVQAPAGSGKTDLLTRRFLCLLSEVEEPGQIVAITFTIPAAAEMRIRILSELEKAADRVPLSPADDAFSMQALADNALQHAQMLGWNLLDQPAQLRISTIDSFCRELALQQPLLSGLGDGLGIYEQPDELYRRAARRTLEKIDDAAPALRAALDTLLLWRDNNWQEMEELLIEMLKSRDRWMHSFVLSSEPDWEQLREQLEQPFAKAVRRQLDELNQILGQIPGVQGEILALARYACSQTEGRLHSELAQLAEFPAAPFATGDLLEEAREAFLVLANLLLTGDGAFRKQINKLQGFPTEGKREKAQIIDLIRRLATIPGFEPALAAVRNLPPARYTEEDWKLVQACFTLLRHAVGELKVAFAEVGAVDFIEVAQIAQSVLKGADGQPTDAAIAVADGIRHILVDEFQDTSRRQHQLLSDLIAAWPEREERTCFVVGDPMQSIYFFRDADAELFPRVRKYGLEICNTDPLEFASVALTANFRTAKPLVEELNIAFDKVFAADDGSGVSFSAAVPARVDAVESAPMPRLNLHLEFVPQTARSKASDPAAIQRKDEIRQQREAACQAQTAQIVDLIRSHDARMEAARNCKQKYRIAVLGRTRSAIAPVAQALREASIPFRAVDLEQLSARPEVLDALALAHALLNPQDRVAWLGVLRAPWCGLSLQDLHTLTSDDNAELLERPVPELLAERHTLLSEVGCLAAARVLQALDTVPSLRFARPSASVGTWLQQVWLRLGGAECVDAAARANLDLLWRSLDSLPNGEQDLLGPALATALGKLTALPDPGAGSDCGVQLMTIHKSKGLEFEVVIIPALQAGTGRSRGKLLSWLERGLPPEEGPGQPDTSAEITEFLVAPLQFKGADSGKAKAWVDQVYRKRESQETRRILYVAATRARDELHVFARPAFKSEKDGSLSLAEPAESLLSTAWPAFEAEIQSRFAAWKAKAASSQPEPATIEAIAATGQSNLLVMPSPPAPTQLRRLPAGYIPAPTGVDLTASDAARLTSAAMESQLYSRHEGGLVSRAFGTAVHALLEELARLRSVNDWQSARAALHHSQPRIAARIRAAGIEPSKASSIAAAAMQQALKASQDPIGQWILSPHAEADAEVRWAGVIAGSLRTVQVDRVFRAGLEPQSAGDDAWWIIDYKTAHADSLDPASALPGLRKLFAPQLETYAKVLGSLHGHSVPIYAGLYYPRMALLDWWKV